MPELTNPRAERVRAVRALAGRSSRERSGRFVVEGPQGVREAVRWAPGLVRALYLSDDAAQRHAEILEDAREAGILPRLGSAEVLDAMSPDAQGVVAVLDQLTADLAATVERRPGLVAVLCTVRDPGNAGTVIRAADAAGADAVVLAGTSVDLHNPKVVRSSAGSIFHLPVVTGYDATTVVTALRGAGSVVLAADGSGSHDLDELLDACGGGAPAQGVPDLAAPTAWLFGNEARGLTGRELTLADASVRVPLHGRAESLNLATAATVCLYASARARRRVRDGT